MLQNVSYYKHNIITFIGVSPISLQVHHQTLFFILLSLQYASSSYCNLDSQHYSFYGTYVELTEFFRIGLNITVFCITRPSGGQLPTLQVWIWWQQVRLKCLELPTRQQSVKSQKTIVFKLTTLKYLILQD
jgi:hypothetical protein